MRRFLFLLILGAPLAVSCCKKAEPENTSPSLLKKPKAADPASAPFVAGKRNRVFHTRGCPYAADLEAPVGYETLRDAEASGRLPCEFCRPNKIEAAPAPEKPAQKP